MENEYDNYQQWTNRGGGRKEVGGRTVAMALILPNDRDRGLFDG
jgi:hypothetical protein